MTEFDLSLVDWSRAQFALTAIYHWIFVPLTLGLSFIVAIMHTKYVKTGSEEWKQITKFWMKLFGINFAIGVATGIILEFEFGTNWSNYSWFVGDIFGAPLAVEGILAFFLESTFIAVMFFGWERVSKKFHMLSSWLVAIGSNLSALWILVANAWMQNPVGMKFNPDTMRSEMDNFFEILLSPSAIFKFTHTITSSYVLGSIFVIGISAWFLLRKRHIEFAKKSIKIAAAFGLLASLLVAFTGDGSAKDIAKTQPMKLAAMEGLYNGQTNCGLVAFGILTPGKEAGDNKEDFVFDIKIPNALSYISFGNADAFVPGINDLIKGNKEQNIISTQEKIEKGKIAIKALADYKEAKKNGDKEKAESSLNIFKANFDNFGYGYFDNPKDIIPPVSEVFYSFHIMVMLGGYFIVLFAIMLWLSYKNKLEQKRLILKVALWTIPLAYLASELGWIVAELGRQPWTIVNLLPVNVSTSHLSTSSVQTTFWMFAVLFTVLLIAEIKIMTKQIKIGPKEKGGQ